MLKYSDSNGEHQQLRITGEILHAPLRLAPLAKSSFHIYAPTDAEGVVRLLEAEAPGLLVASGPNERHLACAFLLYLNDATPWTTLQHEVEVEAPWTTLQHEVEAA